MKSAATNPRPLAARKFVQNQIDVSKASNVAPSRTTLWRHGKRDQGLISLRIWVHELEVPDLLVQAGYLPAHLADDKKAIERALEAYLRAGRAATLEP